MLIIRAKELFVKVLTLVPLGLIMYMFYLSERNNILVPILSIGFMLVFRRITLRSLSSYTEIEVVHYFANNNLKELEEKEKLSEISSEILRVAITSFQVFDRSGIVRDFDILNEKWRIIDKSLLREKVQIAMLGEFAINDDGDIVYLKNIEQMDPQG